jgi:uncharacterized protein YlzI (FlbEa/FlbD family)
MFVENTPIDNLQYLTYESGRDGSEEFEIISALTSSCRTLKGIHLFAEFDSSAVLLKSIECCRDLEYLGFGDQTGELVLEKSDILAISSLHQLSSLKIYGCDISDGAASALSKCRGLKELRMCYLADTTVLLANGRNLVILNLWEPSKEVVDGIVEYCPNLQYLVLVLDEDDDEMERMVVSLKNGLKMLAKLKVNMKSIRLGTDWNRY